MPTPARIPAQPQDAFNDFARIVADQQLGIVVDLPGRLDAERLARAIADVIASQPVLGCRFVAEGRGAWHEVVADAATVAFVGTDASDAWKTAVEAAGQPLDPSSPHLAVTHVRGELSDALAIRIDHTAADGQGAKACAELLAAAYTSALAAAPKASAPAGAAAAETPDRSWRRLRQAVGMPRLVRGALTRTELPPTWGLPAGGGSPERRRHCLVTVPAEQFSARREWGKARGFTANDMILAAFYRAMFSALDTPAGEAMVLRISFDQRRYLSAADPMPAACNLSSIEPLALAPVPDEPFEATVARVHAEMDRLKSGSPGLGNVLLLELLYRVQGYEKLGGSMVANMERGQRAGRSYPFVSNFGVLDATRLRFADATPTRAVMLPVAAHPPFAMLGASSFLGELTLSMGFAESETDPAVLTGILDAMAADLSA